MFYMLEFADTLEKVMPRATFSDNTERHDLKSCPEGYVVIRRMNYGEKLDRQERMLNMQASGDDGTMHIQIKSKKVALEDFANLIIEHNLTNKNDNPLNFRKPQDVLSLDPRIGEEIADHIDKINNFEDNTDTKN